VPSHARTEHHDPPHQTTLVTVGGVNTKVLIHANVVTLAHATDSVIRQAVQDIKVFRNFPYA